MSFKEWVVFGLGCLALGAGLLFAQDNHASQTVAASDGIGVMQQTITGQDSVMNITFRSGN